MIAHKQRIPGFAKTLLLLGSLVIAHSGFAAEVDLSSDEQTVRALMNFFDPNGTARSDSMKSRIRFRPERFKQLLADANAGDITAMNKLVMLYQGGKGIPEDKSEALKWCRKAADMGNSEAMLKLGFMYANVHATDAVEPDDEAIFWWKKAAASGNGDAMSTLGYKYFQLGRATRDARYFDAAINWLMKGAKVNHAQSMYQLGLMYMVGEGVQQSYPQAVDWLRKAASYGDRNAMLTLAYDGQQLGLTFEESKAWNIKSIEAANKEIEAISSVQYDFDGTYFYPQF